MGIISRFTEIMKANINDLLDKAEDPMKMLDQIEREVRENYAQVKKETAGVMANEKVARDKVTECQKEIAQIEAAAMGAVRAGNDDDARQLLARKQAKMEQLTSLQQALDLAVQTSTQMQQMTNKLAGDLETIKIKKDASKAKIQAAKAQSSMNKVMGGTKKTEASLSALQRYEDKADKMLYAAQAEAQLNEQQSSTDSLINKYAGSGSVSVEEELAAMKAKVAH